MENTKLVRILALSDIELPFIHSSQVRERFPGVELVIGCGDLAYTYLEYAQSALNIPVFFVRGNHSKVIEQSPMGEIPAPLGGIDLHRHCFNYKGLLLAGVEGSGRYSMGPFQYSQFQMWAHVMWLVPFLLRNRLRYGRYLDIFVTHASPWGIHDQPDLPHQGIKAFLWLDKVIQPTYHLHGHVHILRPDTVIESLVGRTKVMNVYGYREIAIELDSWREGKRYPKS